MPAARSGDDDGFMSRLSEDVERVETKVHALEHTADVGESAETPLIVLGEVWIVCAAVVLVVLALALIAYRLAT
jgi:hypothetical protein